MAKDKGHIQFKNSLPYFLDLVDWYTENFPDTKRRNNVYWEVMDAIRRGDIQVIDNPESKTNLSLVSTKEFNQLIFEKVHKNLNTESNVQKEPPVAEPTVEDKVTQKENHVENSIEPQSETALNSDEIPYKESTGGLRIVENIIQQILQTLEEQVNSLHKKLLNAERELQVFKTAMNDKDIKHIAGKRPDYQVSMSAHSQLLKANLNLVKLSTALLTAYRDAKNSKKNNKIYYKPDNSNVGYTETGMIVLACEHILSFFKNRGDNIDDRLLRSIEEIKTRLSDDDSHIPIELEETLILIKKELD